MKTPKTSEFSRIQNIRAIYKNQSHFHILIMYMWKPKLKTECICISPKKTKYVDVYLTEDIYDLYARNYKTTVRNTQRRLDSVLVN